MEEIKIDTFKSKLFDGLALEELEEGAQTLYRHLPDFLKTLDPERFTFSGDEKTQELKELIVKLQERFNNALEIVGLISEVSALLSAYPDEDDEDDDWDEDEEDEEEDFDDDDDWDEEEDEDDYGFLNESGVNFGVSLKTHAAFSEVPVTDLNDLYNAFTVGRFPHFTNACQGHLKLEAISDTGSPEFLRFRELVIQHKKNAEQPFPGAFRALEPLSQVFLDMTPPHSYLTTLGQIRARWAWADGGYFRHPFVSPGVISKDAEPPALKFKELLLRYQFAKRQFLIKEAKQALTEMKALLEVP